MCVLLGVADESRGVRHAPRRLWDLSATVDIHSGAVPLGPWHREAFWSISGAARERCALHLLRARQLRTRGWGFALSGESGALRAGSCEPTARAREGEIVAQRGMSGKGENGSVVCVTSLGEAGRPRWTSRQADHLLSQAPVTTKIP
jgi:hypothetical protein